MATRQGTLTLSDDGSFLMVWTGITEADNGSPMKLPAGAYDVTAQTVGDFTASGAVTLQGSNDGTNYAALHEANTGATDIVMTASTKIWKVGFPPLYIRPQATAGTAVSMDVYIHGRINR